MCLVAEKVVEKGKLNTEYPILISFCNLEIVFGKLKHAWLAFLFVT